SSCEEWVPVGDVMPPQLSLRAEIVWRNTGDDPRAAVLVKEEQLRIRPDITRVRRDKEGQISDQANAAGVGVQLELIGLTEEQELRKADLIDLIRQLAACAGQSILPAPD